MKSLDNKFFDNDWFLCLTLILFAPLGIYLLWRNKKYSRFSRVALSILSGFLFLYIIGVPKSIDMLALNENQKDFTRVEYSSPNNKLVKPKKKQHEKDEKEKYKPGYVMPTPLPSNTTPPTPPTQPTPQITLAPKQTPYLAQPSIVTQPSNVTVNKGGEAILSVAAGDGSSTGTLTYQWYSNAIESNNGGTLLSGAANPAFYAPTITEGTTYYYCVVTNQDKTGSAASNTASVTVNQIVSVSPSPAGTSVVSVILDGKTAEIGSSTVENINGIDTAIVRIDDTKLREILLTANPGGVINIPVQGDNPAVSVILSGESIKEMENRNMTLAVNTANVNYTVPVKEIKVDSISSSLGQGLSDFEVKINISNSQDASIKAIENSVNESNFKVISKPVDFSIQASTGNNTVEVKQFDNYVSRQFIVPVEMVANKITTAVTENSDGTIRHVPTYITINNGIYYAKVNSLTNSTYALIWNPKEFADISNHWAKAQINEMYSRKIINGISPVVFEADRSITRAEFATIVVKALGIEPRGTDSFRDVNTSDWFYRYVGTANKNGIILGTGAGTFDPLRSITRQEAMAMVQRAAKIAGMNVTVTDAEISSTLSKFTDYSMFSNWAQGVAAFNIRESLIQGANGLVRPQDKITRAETAIIVMRMLEKSELIDSRIKA